MSSTTEHVVSQLKEDLLKEHHKNSQSSPSHDSDERILDVLNRLDEINIDIDILKETLIGKTVIQFKKKYKYSEDITTKARALVKKWKRIYEDANSATATEQNNDAEVNESCNGNNMEGNYKSDDGDNKDTNNEDGNISSPNGFCDICSKPANFREHIGQLQRCKDCGICVHELCYCTVPTKEIDPNFTCHACKAVNTTVEVNVPSKIGGTGDDIMGKMRELMTVEERPMECVLCLHSSEYHAMHPLYDTCGKEGRQYVLKASGSGKPRRLAWVHTLCAQMLIATKGYLYGVDNDGEWYGSGSKNIDYEDSEDNESARNSSSDESDDEVGGQKFKLGTKIYKEFADEQTGKLCLFKGKVKRFDTRRRFYKIVYTDGDEEEMTESQVKRYLQKPTKVSAKKAQEPVSVATRNFCFNEDVKDEIKEARELKCAVCRKDDTKSLRIPTQCNVGDKGVHTDLQQHYSHVASVCTTAMHVGCARWIAPKRLVRVAGDGNKRVRMTYFYPGQFSGDSNVNKEFPDPVAACFCRVHAKIIQERRNRANEKG